MVETSKPLAVKTYVLIGHNQEDENRQYSKRKDVEILHPKPGQSITDAVREASIQPPANVVLQAHGNMAGQFEWNKNEAVSYEALLAALPRGGILSVTFGSCFAGSVQTNTMLKAAPPGTILQTMTGQQTENLNSTTLKFAAESEGLTRPIDLFLEALDNFNPQQYNDFFEARNKNSQNQAITDPNDALPSIVGLGGNPPLAIDLNKDMLLISKGFNLEAMNRAADRVIQRFDTARGYTAEGDASSFDGEKINKGLGIEAETALNAQVLTIANQIIRGEIPDGKTMESVEAKRIALAITAAYLDESGLLQKAIERQPGYAAFATLDAKGESIAEAAAEKGQRGNLTGTERAYIKSVKEVLRDQPELKGKIDDIIGDLKAAFKQSNGNDGIDHALADTLKGAGVSTKGWER